MNARKLTPEDAAWLARDRGFPESAIRSGWESDPDARASWSARLDRRDADLAAAAASQIGTARGAPQLPAVLAPVGPEPEKRGRFELWEDAGFVDVVPVVPGDVAPDRWSGKPPGIGKTPATLCDDGERWYPLHGWQTIPATPALLAAWSASGANVGLRTRRFPTFDADIDDPAVANVVEGIITSNLELFGGTVAVRRRANSSRFAIPTRLEGAPFRKTTLSFTLPDGREQKVELLGYGQQFVIEGIHASGAAITWSPAEFKAEDLPRLGTALVEIIFQQLGEALARAGCTDIKREGGGGGQVEAEATDARVERVPPGPALNREIAKARSALASLDPAGLDYDEWIRVGQALRHDLREGGLPIWDGWSRRDESLARDGSPRYQGLDDLRQHWRSFKCKGRDHGRCARLGSVYAMAQAAGWAMPADGPGAAEEFAAFADLLGGAPVGGHAAALAAMNSEWFVLDEAGKMFVCRFEFDDLGQGQRERLVHYTREAFVAKHERTQWSEGHKSTTLGKAWLAWPGRRQYGRAVFDPSAPATCTCGSAGSMMCELCRRYRSETLNLWRGFAIAPAPGDWSVIRRHIEDAICSGNRDHAEYLLRWIARLLQHPEEPGEVVTVLRGKEGAGKSVLGYVLRRALGQHGLMVTSPEHVVGRFNAHLRDAVFLQAEEAFFAGDQRQARQLKTLVTGDALAIEAKGVDLVPSPNRLHILMTTNEDWAVAAGPESRRYFVLDVSNAHAQGAKDAAARRAYFGPLFAAARDDQAIAGMLYDLLRLDLSGFDVRDFPVTDALRAQRAQSLTGVLAWAADLAERGHLLSSDSDYEVPWRPFLTTKEMYRDYVRWAERQRYGRTLSRETFGRQLTNALGLDRKCEAPRPLRGDLPEESWRQPGYVVGTADDFARTVRRKAGTEDEIDDLV